jgi:hypothetical protein
LKLSPKGETLKCIIVQHNQTLPKKRGYLARVEYDAGLTLATLSVPGGDESAVPAVTLRLPVSEEAIDRIVELAGADPLEITVRDGVVIGVDRAGEPTPTVDLDAILQRQPSELRAQLHAILTTIVELEGRYGEATDEAVYTHLEQQAGMARKTAIALVDHLIGDGIVYLKAGRLAFPPVQYY